jgi:hypothetical protein
LDLCAQKPLKAKSNKIWPDIFPLYFGSNGFIESAPGQLLPGVLPVLCPGRTERDLHAVVLSLRGRGPLRLWSLAVLPGVHFTYIYGSTSIERPTIDRPTIDRPTIDRQTIDRPTIDQPTDWSKVD